MNAKTFRRAAFGMFAIILLVGIHSEAQVTIPSASGKTPAAPMDIALQADGTMHGELLDQNGTAVAQAAVTLYRDQSPPRTTMTDAQGRFRFTDASSGVAVLTCGPQLVVVRLWAPNTAPPLAKPQVVIYAGGVMRGQGYGPGMSPVASEQHGGAPGAVVFGGLSLPSIHPVQALKSPLTIGALIGGAVALPLALHDDEVRAGRPAS